MRHLDVVLLISVSLAVGCSSEGPNVAAGTPAAASVPAAGAPSAAAAVPEPKTLMEVFPAGAGRDVVLNSCGSCHNVACAAMGERSIARWDALQAAHAERVAGADLDVVFGYLKEHFKEGKPVPRVPAVFLEGGCTPF